MVIIKQYGTALYPYVCAGPGQLLGNINIPKSGDRAQFFATVGMRGRGKLFIKV
jgi:hypothetical protein